MPTWKPNCAPAKLPRLSGGSAASAGPGAAASPVGLITTSVGGGGDLAGAAPAEAAAAALALPCSSRRLGCRSGWLGLSVA